MRQAQYPPSCRRRPLLSCTWYSTLSFGIDSCSPYIRRSTAQAMGAGVAFQWPSWSTSFHKWEGTFRWLTFWESVSLIAFDFKYSQKCWTGSVFQRKLPLRLEKRVDRYQGREYDWQESLYLYYVCICTTWVIQFTLNMKFQRSIVLDVYIM